MNEEIIIAKDVYTDYDMSGFIFKYYNQFFKLDELKKKLKPISGHKIDNLIKVYKIKVNSERLNNINTPIVFVKDKNEYGIIISKVPCIDTEKIIISIKLLSSYFGIDNIIEKTINSRDTIEILSFKSN